MTAVVPEYVCRRTGRQWSFDCPCGTTHHHSPEPGHRVAHCSNDRHPDGYILVGPKNYRRTLEASSALDGVHTVYRRAMMPRTQIYQHEDDVSVVTDAADERDFLDTFTEALNGLKNGANRKAISAGFDIVAKLRGYKSEVQERRVMAAGRWPHPSEKPIAEAGVDAATE